MPVGDPTVTLPTKVEIEIDGTKHVITPDGDIKDENGTILKTKDEVAELLKKNTKTPEQIEAERLAEEVKRKAAEDAKKNQNQNPDPFVLGAQIEIDGVTYTIDKDGNAIDAQNKVVKTKSELKQLYDANSPSSVTPNYIEEVQKVTNLVVVKGDKPIEYENTVEGFTGYVQDVHQLGVELGKKKDREELFTQFPVLKQVLSHLILNNGDISNFNNTIDYSTIKINDDEQQWENIYITAKVAQGISKEEAVDMFKYLKEDKKAKAAAESSLVFLVKTQDARNKQAEALLAKQEQDAQLAEEQYWNEVSTIVKSKVLKVKDQVFAIPDVIRVKDKEGRTITKTLDDFVKYMSSPIVVTIDGQQYTTTQVEYDKYLEEQNRKTDDDVLDAYRRFTGFDDSQLIAKNVRQQQTKEILKLTTKTTTSSNGNIDGKNGGKIILPMK